MALSATLSLAAAAHGQGPGPAAAGSPAIYDGRVVELLTEQPIAGALVVFLWEFDGDYRVGREMFALREVLTDAAGRFRVDATAIEASAPPGARPARFLVYKPGYVASPRERGPEFGNPAARLREGRGVVALKPVKDLEERVEAYNTFAASTNRLAGDEIRRLWREELQYFMKHWPQTPGETPSGRQP